MSSRIRPGLVLAAFILSLPLAGLVAYLLLGDVGADRLHSPPAVPRPWAEAEFRAFEAPVPDPSPLAPEFCTIVRNLGIDAATPGKLKLAFEQEPAQAEYTAPIDLVRLSDDLTFATPDGTGRVEWLAFGTIDPANFDPERDGYLRLQAFDPALQPLPADRYGEFGLSESDIARWMQRDRPGTAAAFRVALGGFDDVRWWFRQSFDLATRVPLGSGGSWSSLGPACTATTQLKCVHNTPVRFVLDFAHGPSRRETARFAEGETIATPDYRFQLHVVARGLQNGYSTSSRQADECMIEIDLEDKPGAPATTIAYELQPASISHALTLEAISADGRRIPSHGGGAGGGMRITSFQAAPEEIETIEVAFRPHRKRLLIDLPRLPGTPDGPANQSPADLFDVRVPYFECQSEDDLQRVVADLVQHQRQGYVFSVHHGTAPASFPMTFENTTPRRIIEEYRAMAPNVRVFAEPSDLTLHFDGPPTGLSPFQRLLHAIGRLF